MTSLSSCRMTTVVRFLNLVTGAHVNSATFWKEKVRVSSGSVKGRGQCLPRDREVRFGVRISPRIRRKLLLLLFICL